jgi:hypothetical protein
MVALAPFGTGALGDLGCAQVGQVRQRSRELLALLTLLDIQLITNRSFHKARVPRSPIFTQWFVLIVAITKIYGCS